MLPPIAAGAAQDVSRTRFKDLLQWFCAFRWEFLYRPGTKLHRAFAEERHANNDIKSRRIAMPPNRSSGRIVGYEYLRKLLRISRREFGDALSQRREKLRDWRRRSERSGFVCVTPAEVNYAPLRDDIAHLHLRELELLDCPNERLFFLV